MKNTLHNQHFPANVGIYWVLTKTPDGRWLGWSELISVDLRTFLLHVGHMVVEVGLTWVNFSWLEFGWEKNFWFRVGRLVRVVGPPPPPPDLPPSPSPDISGQWTSREDALYTGHPLILNLRNFSIKSKRPFAKFFPTDDPSSRFSSGRSRDVSF